MKKLALILICALFLTACGSYNIQVDLTPEQRAEIEAKIEELKEEIENFQSENTDLAWRPIIKMAEAYEDLGELDKAIKTYKDVLDSGKKTRAIIHNLGRLYEKVGEYDLAIEQYQRIVDEYFDMDYLYDITWAHIRAKNRKEAEKYFNAWQLEFRKTDEQTQKAIKDLRAEEKANSAN